MVATVGFNYNNDELLLSNKDGKNNIQTLFSEHRGFDLRYNNLEYSFWSHPDSYYHYRSKFYPPVVLYISDIHFDCFGNEKINDIINSLTDSVIQLISEKYHEISRLSNIIILFGGDFSDNSMDAREFLKLFDDILYEKIKLCDDIYSWELVVRQISIVTVAGNHDYIYESNTRNNISKIERIVHSRLSVSSSNFNFYHLNNNYIELSDCIIVGGTGWAYYNNNFNSSNLKGPKYYNREYEKYYGNLLNLELRQSLNISKRKGLPVICLSHYPVKDWIDPDFNFDSNQILFISGHTHQNGIYKYGESYELFDNQIGRKNINLDKYKFKDILVSPIINPYLNVDKYRRTSIDELSLFYIYKGVSASLMNLIKNGLTEIYVMKYYDYYCFVTYDKTKGKFYLLNGGKYNVKNNFKSIKLEDVYNEFVKNVSFYENSLLMSFNVGLTMFSQKIKDLGFSGNKHGLIIDFDSTSHIMFDPINKKVLYYESSYYDWSLRRIFVPKDGKSCIVKKLDQTLSILDKNNFVETIFDLLPESIDVVNMISANCSYLLSTTNGGYYLDSDFLNYSSSREYNKYSKFYDKNILVKLIPNSDMLLLNH